MLGGNEHDDVEGDAAGELDPEAELVALHLAEGASHAEAGLAIGRSAKWVQRRLADPVFRARVMALKAMRVEQASAGLANLLERAIRVVERNLDAERPADQLQAARLVLDRSRAFRQDVETLQELADLRTQVAELRAALDARAAARRERSR